MSKPGKCWLVISPGGRVVETGLASALPVLIQNDPDWANAMAQGGYSLVWQPLPEAGGLYDEVVEIKVEKV